MREHMKTAEGQSRPGSFFQFGGAGSSTVAIAENAAPSSMSSMFVAQLLDVHDYERKRLGQELHDSAGQLLVSLQMSVAQLRSALQNCGQTDLIDEIQRTVREIDHDIRALAFLDYPAELGQRSLSEAVQALAQGFGKRTGIRTTFTKLGELTAVTNEISLTLLRVAQEALVNVHRHSRAASVNITLRNGADGLHLTVCDDGIGIPADTDSARGRGIGLEGMRCRVEMNGGRFEIRGLKHGTKISAIMPRA
jgi:signal transduction histidine kinase